MTDLDRLTPEARALYEAMLAEQSAGSRPTTDRFPASESQRRLWQLGRLAPESAWGNLPLCFEVRGEVDVEALGRALNDLVDRQSVLRTTYVEDADGVWGSESTRTEDVLSVEPNGDIDAAVARLQERARRPMDVASGPLFSAQWMSTGASEGVLALMIHHLVTDGWSIGLLLRELSHAYAARVAGSEPDLAELRGSFASEAHAEASSELPAEEVEYWRGRLEGAPLEPPLPAMSGGVDLRSARVLGRLDAATSDGLRALATAERVTPFAALLGALQTLLSAYTGQDDVVVGTTVSVRHGSAREGLVGNFGNNVLLRADLGGAPTWRGLLATARDTVPGDLARQRVPLERLLADGARIPRLGVLFMLRDGAPDAHLELPGCEVAYRPLEVGAATVDLTLDVFDLGSDGFAFAVEHRLDRIDAGDAHALARDFETTVRTMVETPDASIAAAPVRRDVWGGEVEQGTRESGADVDDDLTPSEALLAGLWRDALGLEFIDPHDNFFELGGHSLLAISILERVETEVGVRLTPVDLVSQTLAQLAAAIDEAAA